MNRREILIALATSALSNSVTTQEPTTPTIGFLHSASAAPNVALVNEFKKGLFAAGYIEGKNVEIEYRWAEGRLSRLPHWPRSWSTERSR
jgi:putative ABC transport system substrate-binding protein